MKIKSLLIFPLILQMALSCSGGKHFISDSKIRDEVKSDFEKRATLFRDSSVFLNIAAGSSLSAYEKEAMEFLYAYMPLCDIADYDNDYFIAQLRTSLEAKSFFKWGKKVPEELFRHFVLPPRVNNENLDTARQFIFRELKERIKGMSMYDAALEVNHWCHEKVTYRGSDNRTSAPLATMKSAYGRCGEESTFTVAALRAVGLPARQCYTPRWAHTDDNHAWVEVWCDGKWYYLGACEPEPILNRAWFSAPALRAMMVHTNVFGKYYGPEERQDFPLYSKINVLSNYTKVKTFKVKVTGNDGKPVNGAKVNYLLYNYSEFYPIYTNTTDSRGYSSVTSGYGDLLIQASSDSLYGYRKVSLAHEDSTVIALSMSAGKGAEYIENMDITPPPAVAVKDSVSKEMVERNSARLKSEDSLRNSYIAGFMSRKEAKERAIKFGLDTTQVINYIVKSEGNWRDIYAYIEKNAGNKFVLKLLCTLSDKDLRDTPAAVLESHLLNCVPFVTSGKIPEDVYVEGILSPVIYYELIRAWRPIMKEQLSAELGQYATLERLKSWTIENIVKDDSSNYAKCQLSPAGTLKIRRADKISRDIFFTALCRSYGIPARFDKATLLPEVYENGKWNAVELSPEAKPMQFGRLTLTMPGKSVITPQYWSNYTIARFVNGSFIALDFENDPRVAKMPAQLDLEAGYYRLCTGKRMSDGSVLVRNEYFNIVPGGKVSKEIIIRDSASKREILGVADASLACKIQSDKGCVICFIDPDKEPTKHLMQELPGFKDQFDRWGGRFMFVIPDGKLTGSFNASAYHGLPVKSTFITSEGEKLLDQITRSVRSRFTGSYPLVVVINGSNEIIYFSEGYRIGLGESIVHVIIW